MKKKKKITIQQPVLAKVRRRLHVVETADWAQVNLLAITRAGYVLSLNSLCIWTRTIRPGTVVLWQEMALLYIIYFIISAQYYIISKDLTPYVYTIRQVILKYYYNIILHRKVINQLNIFNVSCQWVNAVFKLPSSLSWPCCKWYFRLLKYILRRTLFANSKILGDIVQLLAKDPIIQRQILTW